MTLKKDTILRALALLDQKLPNDTTLIVGGGGALIGVYNFPLATSDVDAVPVGSNVNLAELDFAAKEVAEELGLPGDWLNPYYSTFMFVLPEKYSTRLRELYKGKKLNALALGPEDLLIMKCFAARDKDVPHARALLKQKPDLELVEGRILELKEQGIKGAQRALDFFDEVTKEL